MSTGDRARVIGSTIRNTVEMHRMATEERRVNSAAMPVSSRAAELVVVVALAASVARAVLVVPEDLAVKVASAALVVPEDQAVQVALAGSVVPEDQAVRVALAASVVPEDQAVQVALAASVVPEDPVVRVALGAPENPAVAELVLVIVPAEAVPAQGRPRAQVVVPLKTKSAIAVHHRGLVRVPKKAEDLVAVAAETTHGPVATEAVTAWAAAE